MSSPSIAKTVQQALEMLANGIAENTILAHLVNAAERLVGENSVSSILILDRQGLLRNACSPKLPHDYLHAIDGLRPNPNVGTCAAVAATGAMVVTLDFRSDDKWGELRHLPLSLGFVGAWSLPIKDMEGRVLGTFGTYLRESRPPSEKEIEGKQALAHAAARVLQIR